MKKICILSLTDVIRDARVVRQISFASRHYNLAVIGYTTDTQKPSERVRYISLPKPVGIKRLFNIGIILVYLGLMRILPKSLYRYWVYVTAENRNALELLLATPADLVQVHDWRGLPLAVLASQKTRSPIVLDLHEWAPAEGEQWLWWRVLFKPLIKYILATYSQDEHIKGITTVNQQIADLYKKEYGLTCEVIINAPSYNKAIGFRATQKEPIKLIHHGGASPARELEKMIEALAYLDNRYELYFMLVGEGSYVKKLKLLAKKIAPGRVHFKPSVNYDDVVMEISKYDIGFYLLAPVQKNHILALPNKFLDFIMAGLAVVIGPSPVMADIVKRYETGIVCAVFDPKEVAEQIAKLAPAQIDKYKRSSLKARKELNAENELQKLLDMYALILKG